MINQISLINEQIEKEYKPKNDAYPIYDGIINEESYLNSQFKILWILKEPYDDVDENGSPSGGDWNLVKAIDENLEGFSKIKTWQQIIYCSYGILNNFVKYSQMDYYNEGVMKDILKKIAAINIQKLPAHTTSNDFEISSAYYSHKELLFKQIEIINPDIIIGGNTLKYFKNDLQFDKLQTSNTNEKYVEHYFDEKRIYIDAYHPSTFGAQAGWSKELYIDSIIETVEKWIKWKNNDK